MVTGGQSSSAREVENVRDLGQLPLQLCYFYKFLIPKISKKRFLCNVNTFKVALVLSSEKEQLTIYIS